MHANYVCQIMQCTKSACANNIRAVAIYSGQRYSLWCHINAYLVHGHWKGLSLMDHLLQTVWKWWGHGPWGVVNVHLYRTRLWLLGLNRSDTSAMFWTVRPQRGHSPNLACYYCTSINMEVSGHWKGFKLMHHPCYGLWEDKEASTVFGA